MFTTVIKMILQTCSKMVLSNREGITCGRKFSKKGHGSVNTRAPIRLRSPGNEISHADFLYSSLPIVFLNIGHNRVLPTTPRQTLIDFFNYSFLSAASSDIVPPSS